MASERQLSVGNISRSTAKSTTASLSTTMATARTPTPPAPVTVPSVIKWLENINLNDNKGEIMGLGITNGTRIIVEKVKPLRLQPGLEKFTVFPNLPAELRLKIWRRSIPGPRIITIISGSCKHDKNCRGLKVCVKHRPMAKTRSSNEFSVSGVNRESRQELLRTHRFSFKGDLKFPIYFNFKRDTLFFLDEGALHQFDAVIRTVGSENRAKRLYNNLRHVMVVMHGAHLGSGSDEIIGEMLKLETMRIVVSDLCKKSITSMGLENERALHEEFLQGHWSHNGAEVFPTVTLHSVAEDDWGELVVGEPHNGNWGRIPNLGYRASRRVAIQSKE